MLLSVIVVNWNARDDLALCLASLEAVSGEPVEIVVVDNGSQDNSAAMVRKDFPGVRLLEEGANLGFAEGCNRGIEASTGTWAVLLNNDAVVERDWAERLTASIGRAPDDCGMLQCTMYFLDKPGVVNSLGLWLKRDGGAIDRGEGKTAVPGHDEEIFCPTGGAAAYRRTMLEQIRLSTGYLDRDHFCYCEDFDIGWRAQLAGWRARLAHDAVVHHRWHGSTRKRGRGWFVTMTRLNRIRTLLKNASPGFLAATMPFTLWELAELGWHGGLKSCLKLPAAVRESLRVRPEVSQLAQGRHRAVEKRWVGVR